MKRLYILVFSLIVFQGSLNAQYAGDTESFIPDNPGVFVKTKKISDLLRVYNYAADNFTDSESKKEILAARDSFREKTGIDYMSGPSLRAAGIDTERRISFFGSDNDRGREMMMFFLPVLNEKEFPLRFVQIVKKMKSGKEGDEIDIYPVITSYEGKNIYQMGRDIFATALKGYFVVASNGDMIKGVIDHAEKRDGTLILSEEYNHYLKNARRNFDVNVYVSGDFIKKLNGSGGDEKNIKLKKTAGVKKNRAAHDVNEILDSIRYASGGMGLDGNMFQMNGAVSLNTDNSLISYFMDILKTGQQENFLDIQGADTSVFLSLDYDFLNRACRKDMPGCSQFKQFKDKFKEDLGLDFEKDIIPYYLGVSNVIAVDSGSAGGAGDYVAFLPFNNAGKIVQIFDRLKILAKQKNEAQKKFGEQKINGRRAYWFIDKNMMRNFVSYDGRGIFAGNSENLIARALDSTLLQKHKGRTGALMNDKTFFMVNVKKNRMIRSLLMMRAAKNPEAARALSRIGEVIIYGEKRPGILSLDLEVELRKGNSKK